MRQVPGLPAGFRLAVWGFRSPRLRILLRSPAKTTPEEEDGRQSKAGQKGRARWQLCNAYVALFLYVACRCTFIMSTTVVMMLAVIIITIILANNVMLLDDCAGWRRRLRCYCSCCYCYYNHYHSISTTPTASLRLLLLLVLPTSTFTCTDGVFAALLACSAMSAGEQRKRRRKQLVTAPKSQVVLLLQSSEIHRQRHR